MSKKHDICALVLVRREPDSGLSASDGQLWRVPRSLPITEIIPGIFDGLSRFIPGVDLGVNNMTFGNRDGQKIVYMRREVLEARLVAHEAVYINQQ